MFKWLTALGNPERFLTLSQKVKPWIAVPALILLAVGLYMSFFTAPADYQQGQTSRIMYIHVPCAWLAMMCYTLMTASALGTLVWKLSLIHI